MSHESRVKNFVARSSHMSHVSCLMSLRLKGAL